MVAQCCTYQMLIGNNSLSSLEISSIDHILTWNPSRIWIVQIWINQYDIILRPFLTGCVAAFHSIGWRRLSIPGWRETTLDSSCRTSWASSKIRRPSLNNTQLSNWTPRVGLFLMELNSFLGAFARFPLKGILLSSHKTFRPCFPWKTVQLESKQLLIKSGAMSPSSPISHQNISTHHCPSGTGGAGASSLHGPPLRAAGAGAGARRRGAQRAARLAAGGAAAAERHGESLRWKDGPWERHGEWWDMGIKLIYPTQVRDWNGLKYQKLWIRLWLTD